MHIILVLFTVAAAYWVYNDAKSNGQETSTVLLWTVGTLIMMIVVLPMYLLFGRNSTRKPRRNEKIIDVEAIPVDDSEKINCPMCGSKVQQDFKLCPYCGYTLKRKCEKCGQELSREWKTCPYCQTPSEDK